MRESAIRTPLIRQNIMNTTNNDIVIPTPVVPIAPPNRPRATGNNDDGGDDGGYNFSMDAADRDLMLEEMIAVLSSDNVGN